MKNAMTENEHHRRMSLIENRLDSIIRQHTRPTLHLDSAFDKLKEDFTTIHFIHGDKIFKDWFKNEKGLLCRRAEFSETTETCFMAAPDDVFPKTYRMFPCTSTKDEINTFIFKGLKTPKVNHVQDSFRAKTSEHDDRNITLQIDDAKIKFEYVS
jgi:hypothetical protein